MYSRRHENGAILIISLWILVILSMLAIGIGHKLSLEIRLLHNHLDSTKAFYIAKAGVLRAIAERAKLLQAKETIYADSFNQPWFNSEALFKDIKLGDGSYTIQNPAAAGVFGMADEQAKININIAGFDVLKNLLLQVAESSDEAVNIAASIIDWRDLDADIFQDPDTKQLIGTEDNCKNSNFDVIEELLLVKGVTSEIYSLLKNYATIYGSGAININTADEIVLASVLDEPLPKYIINTRQPVLDMPTGKWFVATDDVINEDVEKIVNIHSDTADPGLPGSDTDKAVLWDNLRSQETAGVIGVQSSVFRINSIGTVNRIKRVIETVVKLESDGQYKFLFWRQR